MPVPSPDKHRGALVLESTICMHVKCNYFFSPHWPQAMRRRTADDHNQIRTLCIRVLHKFQNTIFCSQTANTSNLHITIDLETRQTNISSNFRKKKNFTPQVASSTHTTVWKLYPNVLLSCLQL